MSKGFHAFQLFKNMIPGPPSKLIWYFPKTDLFKNVKTQWTESAVRHFFTDFYWFRCSSASWNRYSNRWKNSDFDEIWWFMTWERGVTCWHKNRKIVKSQSLGSNENNVELANLFDTTMIVKAISKCHEVHRAAAIRSESFLVRSHSQAQTSLLAPSEITLCTGI